jgi:methyl-accepting chemotaxis protein
MDEREKLIREAVDVCQRAAHGDLESRILFADRAGDLATLFHSINQLLDMSDAFVREASVSLDNVANDRFYRRILERGMRGAFGRAARAVNDASSRMGARSRELAAVKAAHRKMTDEFEHRVKAVSVIVASASTQLQASARALRETAARTSTQSAESEKASASTSESVSTVAAAAEELSASIRDIDQQARQTSTVAQVAVERRKVADATVVGLSEAATKIGRVAKLISGVASQTNLLSLNAAIEAARAGEAGKGFSVVAAEVKKLAGETARATSEIDEQVASIFEATRDVVEAIRAIGGTIDEVSGAAASISATVKEQGAATREIAASAERAAGDTARVSSNVAGIAHAARDTGNAAGELLAAADSLSREAEALNAEVDRFLGVMRAA